MENYIIALGQGDNIGDIVLRRRFLQSIQSSGHGHIYVGSNPAAYVEALRLAGDYKLYTSYPRWLSSLMKATLKSKVSVVHDAGELGVTLKAMLLQLSLFPASLLARFRGGHVIRTGVGLRRRTKFSRMVLRTVTLLDSVTYWRDSMSINEIGRGSVAPDWGFDDHSERVNTEQARAHDLLTITMRFDRPMPTPEWFEAIRALSVDNGLRICVVSQVIRDNTRGEAIASKLDADFVPWEGRSHLEQERELRGYYRRSKFVMSDRLHALIMGMVEGALPIGTVYGKDEKIARHMHAAGLLNVSFSYETLSSDEIIERMMAIAEQAPQLSDALARAQHKIRELDRRIMQR